MALWTATGNESRAAAFSQRIGVSRSEVWEAQPGHANTPADRTARAFGGAVFHSPR